MFEDFTNVWTPVAASEELERAAPLGLRLADVPLALFRDAEGRPAAVLDRCPHRGVALSLGKVEEGRLQCPFHGWEFDREGASCRIPWNPDARRDRLGVTAFPAHEVGGQIWVYTGHAPPGPPETADVFTSPHVRVSGFTMPIEAHWTRVMENMLDWPHLPFVHRSTIGRAMVASSASGRMDIELEDRPYGFTTQIAIDGTKQTGRLDFRFPNMMVLSILDGSRTLTMQVACVPESASRTRMVITMARSFLKLGLLDAIFHYQNRKIAMQDKAVIESSWPVEVPKAGEERSVRTDEPTLRFRKIYFDRLRGSSSSTTSAPIPAERLTRTAGAKRAMADESASREG